MMNAEPRPLRLRNSRALRPSTLILSPVGLLREEAGVTPDAALDAGTTGSAIVSGVTDSLGSAGYVGVAGATPGEAADVTPGEVDGSAPSAALSHSIALTCVTASSIDSMELVRLSSGSSRVAVKLKISLRELIFSSSFADGRCSE